MSLQFDLLKDFAKEKKTNLLQQESKCQVDVFPRVHLPMWPKCHCFATGEGQLFHLSVCCVCVCVFRVKESRRQNALEVMRIDLCFEMWVCRESAMCKGEEN